MEESVSVEDSLAAYFKRQPTKDLRLKPRDSLHYFLELWKKRSDFWCRFVDGRDGFRGGCTVAEKLTNSDETVDESDFLYSVNMGKNDLPPFQRTTKRRRRCPAMFYRSLLWHGRDSNKYIEQHGHRIQVIETHVDVLRSGICVGKCSNHGVIIGQRLGEGVVDHVIVERLSIRVRATQRTLGRSYTNKWESDDDLWAPEHDGRLIRCQRPQLRRWWSVLYRLQKWATWSERVIGSLDAPGKQSTSWILGASQQYCGRQSPGQPPWRTKRPASRGPNMTSDELVRKGRSVSLNRRFFHAEEMLTRSSFIYWNRGQSSHYDTLFIRIIVDDYLNTHACLYGFGYYVRCTQSPINWFPRSISFVSWRLDQGPMPNTFWECVTSNLWEPLCLAFQKNRRLVPPHSDSQPGCSTNSLIATGIKFESLME